MPRKRSNVTERIELRCTPEEKASLIERAAVAGLSLSGFLLWEALGEELGQAILDRSRPRNEKLPLDTPSPS